VATPSPPPSTPPQEPPSLPPPDDKTWEDKFKTVSGRYEVDRKKFRETTDQMAQQITQLQGQLATRTAPAPQPPPKLEITPQELEDYGEDFVGMIQRIARHTVEGRIQPLAAEVGRTQQQVRVQENQSMHEQMNALFPQWAQLNQDQRFIEWVMLPDPYSGAIRQILMQSAWDNGDARRVNAFFQGFLAEEAALNPTGAGRPQASAPAAPTAPAATPPLSLAALAAPGGARSASPAPADKPTYTTDDITRFYTEVAAGKWRHRDQERAQIDRDIHQAQHEGRIIMTQRRYVPPAPPAGMTR
jgi:hypothetical protein